MSIFFPDNLAHIYSLLFFTSVLCHIFTFNMVIPLDPQLYPHFILHFLHKLFPIHEAHFHLFITFIVHRTSFTDYFLLLEPHFLHHISLLHSSRFVNIFQHFFSTVIVYNQLLPHFSTTLKHNSQSSPELIFSIPLQLSSISFKDYLSHNLRHISLPNIFTTFLCQICYHNSTSHLSEAYFHVSTTFIIHLLPRLCEQHILAAQSFVTFLHHINSLHFFDTLLLPISSHFCLISPPHL